MGAALFSARCCLAPGSSGRARFAGWLDGRGQATQSQEANWLMKKASRSAETTTITA